MSIARIPDLGDRRIATKVLSDLTGVAGTEGVGEFEQNILSAYRLIKNSGEQVTELRLKEITNAISTGQISGDQAPALFEDQPSRLADPTFAYNPGNFIQRNADRLAQGQGHAPLGQPYGTPDDIDHDAGFGEQAMDAIGAFTWNFADSLLLGLPGLAYSKGVKPLIGESGFTDFIDGVKTVETEAGIWGERLGVAGSFLLPGGIIRGVSKAGAVGAGKAIGKANLIGKVFGAGGKISREVQGFSKVAREAETAAKGIKAIDTAEDIKRLEGGLAELGKARKALRDQKKLQLRSIRRGEKGAIKDLNEEFFEAFAKNTLDQQSIKAQLNALEKVGKNTGEIGKIMGEGIRKGADAFYNTKKGMTAKQVTEAGAEGLKTSLKSRVTANVRKDLVELVGDDETAELILKRVYGMIDDNLEAVVSGDKLLGHMMAGKFPWSERVGKIIQNGLEEAVGFSAHTFLHTTIKELSDTDDYSMENLNDIAKEAFTGAGHSAITAAIFAAGGGVPVMNSTGTIWTAPIKLFAPSRRGDMKSFFKSFLGLNGHSAEVFAGSSQKFLSSVSQLEKELASMRRGIGGGTGSILKRLRQRNIIDYDRLASESPEAIATILDRIALIEKGALGELTHLSEAGGYVGRDGLRTLASRLRRSIEGGDTEQKRKLLQEATGFLKDQAERSIEFNWRSNLGAFKYDSAINALTGMSIFMGADGQAMIDGMGRNETHLADIFTHALFSFSSASHGLHMLPGRSIGDPTIDTKLTASDRFLADAQNRGISRALGLDIGTPNFFKNMNVAEENPFLGDGPEMKRLRDLAESSVTPEEVERMEIVPDSTESINPSTQAFVSDARTILRHLRDARVVFPEGSTFSVLNKVIDRDTIMTDGELLSDSTGITKTLAAYAAKMRAELIRAGTIGKTEAYIGKLDDSKLMDYARESTQNILRITRDMTDNGIQQIKRILQLSKNSFGEISIGDLKDIKVEGIENGDARYMLNRLLDVAHTTGVTIRDHDSPIALKTREQKIEMLEALRDINTEFEKNLNGVGLNNVNLARSLDAMIRSGAATTGKAIMVDNYEVPVLKNREVVGNAGKEHINRLAQLNGFVSYQGDGIPVIRKVNARALEESGLSREQIREIRNFMDVLRASVGFKAKIGKELSRSEVDLFWDKEHRIEELETGFTLSQLTRGMGLDFRSNFVASDMENHIMRAVTSKISPDKFAAYNLLKSIGIIYDDPVHGRVALPVSTVNAEGPIDEVIIRTIENMGTRHELRAPTKDKDGNIISQSEFHDYLNKELAPLIKDLIDIGVVNSYAPKGSFAQFNGTATVQVIAEKLIEVAEGRKIATNEQAKKQVMELVAFLNEMDAKKKDYPEIDFKKVKLLSGKIVNLVGKGKPSVYDWTQVARIMKKYGVFTNKEVNKAQLKNAIDEVENYVRDRDYIDSVVESWDKGGHEAKLDEYDHIINNEKDGAYTLNKLLGSEGLDYHPDLHQALRIDLARAAKQGSEAFQATLDHMYRQAPSNYRPLSRVESNALFSSLAGSRSVKRYTLGEFHEQVGTNEEGEWVGAGSGVKVDNVGVPEGYLTRMGDFLGIDVGLLSGTVKLSDTSYSFFRRHDGRVEKAKRNLLDSFQNGTHDQLVADNISPDVKWRIENSNTRKAVLSIGDLGNFVVFELPTNEAGAKDLGARMKLIADRYGEEAGAFGIAHRNLLEMIAKLEKGNWKGAFGDKNSVNNAFRFIMLHEMLGVSGMERIPETIAQDKVAATVSRFRQMHSRQFTPANREAIESVLANDAPGYSNGRMKGAILSDKQLKDHLGNVLPEGGVTRADGQVWFHSKILNAQGQAHGHEGEHGVIKNMIIDRDMRPVVDAEGKETGEMYNQGTFLTKNAGASTPEMDALMEKLGVSFIAAESAVKLQGSREVGKLIGANGGEVTLSEYFNGKSVTGIEGVFDIAIESLRFNKVPHESEATIGYQIENMLRNDIVRDISNLYYNSQFEGSGGLRNLSIEVFASGVDGRAKLRTLVRRQLEASRFSEKIDLGNEFAGSSIANAYLDSSPYGSPNDFWFAPRALSVLKKGVMQNSIFKTKESSGRQDILAPDVRGVLGTHEGLFSYGAREITIRDQFDGKGELGINFAIKLDGATPEEVAAYNALYFGWKGNNYFNRLGVGSGDAIEGELGQSKYAYARLFRSEKIDEPNRVNGRESFIVTALRHGLANGKKGGVFRYMQGMKVDSPEFTKLANALNNYVIDAIQGRPNVINLQNMEFIPPQMLEALSLEATRASARSAELDFTNIPDGHHKIGKVMDVVGSVLGHYEYHSRRAGSEQGKQSITWGISGLNQRYPSARPNDTIPIVFLGNLHRKMGNQVMLNYYDSTLKGEADYDIDNYNYWFRTPKSHLSEANRLRNAVGINKTDPPRQKADSAQALSLNPFSEKDMMQYAEHQERASFLRGVTIKSASLVEKMLKDKMSITYQANDGSRYRITHKPRDLEDALSTTEGLQSFMKASKMVQEIIDSKKGLLSEAYMNESFDPFRVVMEEFYKVQRVDRDGKVLEDNLVLDDLHIKMARGAIAPYSNLLSFSKKSWVGDSTESMTWDQMRDIVVGWSEIMDNNPEVKLPEYIKSYIGEGTVSNVSVSMERTRSMAEDAATKIIDLDNIVSTGEASELYGKKAADLAELSRYLLDSANWNSDKPTPDQVAKFAAEIRTKNWSVKQALARRSKLASQLRFSDKLAAKGDKYHMRRAELLRSQLQHTNTILEAANRGAIEDPKIMRAFDNPTEAHKAFKNTVSMEAFKVMLAKRNVDPGILSRMKKDAQAIQRERGKLWARELNALASGETKVFGEARNIALRNMVQKYIDTYYVNAGNFGELSYAPETAIIVLAMPGMEYAYKSPGNKTYAGYKNIPADLFNMAMELSFKGRPSQMRDFLAEMGKTYAHASQWMSGKSNELAEIMRIAEIKDNADKLISVASRYDARRNEVITRGNVVRNLGVGGPEMTDKQVLGEFFGIPIDNLAAIGRRTPQQLLQENIAIVQRRQVDRVTVKDIDGTEHVLNPLVRVDLNEGAYLSDTSGVAYREAEQAIRDKKARDGEFFDEQDMRTKANVQKAVDRQHARMVDLILSGKSDFEPNAVGGGGDPQETLRNIVETRSGRESNHKEEGICN